jgi:hypothetical protein
MSTQSRIALYDLLPAIYRSDDEKSDGPLKAFLSVVQEQVNGVQDNIGQLYADLFIETCAECLIPYIGDLVGNRPLHDLMRTRRADVARTLYYRRRKGTLPALEELARDVTGWSVHAVPFFESLVWTQNLNHRRDAGKSATIRNPRVTDLLNGAFERTSHSVDVRDMGQRTGRYHPKRVGFFMWRLNNYHMDGSMARREAAPNDHGFHVSPFGIGTQLFQRPEDLDSGLLTEERHVCQPIRRMAFFDNPAVFADPTVTPSIHAGDGVNFGSPLSVTPMNLSAFAQPAIGTVGLDARLGRISFAAGEIPVQVGVSYRGQELVLAEQLPAPNEHIFRFALLNLTVEHGIGQVPISTFRYMDLSSWIRPASGQVGVDLGLGRLSFAVSEEPTTDVHFRFGRDAAKIAKQASAPQAHGYLLQLPTNPNSLRITRDGAPIPPQEWFCMRLNAWARPPALHVGIDVELGRLTFSTGEEPAGAVVVSYDYGFPADISGGPYDRTVSSRPGELVNSDAAESLRATVAFPDDPAALELRVGAGDFVAIDDALNVWRAAGRPNCRVRIQDNRAYAESLVLDLGNKNLILEADPGCRPVIFGGATTTGGAGDATLLLSGLWMPSGLAAQGNLRKLIISHCTIAPTDPGALDIGGAVGQNQSITVEIERSVMGGIAVPANSDLAARDSITRNILSDGVCTLERVTVLGSAALHEIILISECILTEEVTVSRRQAGCVRYSSLPSSSETPRRYRCQPDLAIESVTPAQQAAAEVRVTPVFTSTLYGAAAYGQLAAACAREIAAGGEDGCEMGAYRFLLQGWRADNLRLRLEEYLPFGLRAGIIYMS